MNDEIKNRHDEEFFNGVSGVSNLFQDNGKWYFWDETWAQFLGPYDNEFQAKQASDEYFQVYLQTGVYTDLLKNKDWHDGEELKGQSFKIING